ncbi:MAG: hypothetical protein IJD10_04045 [Clostridia bacterium]|nr:hypothetical protein [Clostridia bacterium]
MEEQGQGYLTVNVRTAGGALPVEGATVTIKTVDGENSTIVAVMITDSAGTGDIVSLPAPPRENSQQPGDRDNVCSFYTIDTDRDGYYPVVNENVPVFDGITAIQQVLLVPIAGGRSDLRPYDLTRFTAGQLPDL